MVPVVIESLQSVVQHPLAIFVMGVILVVFFLVKLKLPAFLGLILTTFLTAIITPQIPLGDVAPSTAAEFGDIVGDIGILIFMAAIIGKTLTESGAAERIVREILSITGEKRPEVALLGSSYIISIPVWFDNVFYLLAPIARAMRVRTGGNLALYIGVLAAGGVATHSFVPPTPGPIAVASELGVDLAIAIAVGSVVALISSVCAGLIYGHWLNRRMEIPIREVMGTTEEDLEEVVEKSTDELPGLFEASLPIVLAVVLIAGQALLAEFVGDLGTVGSVTAFIGEPNVALTLAALASTWTYYRMSDIELGRFHDEVTEAIKDGGNIVAIMASGAAFGSVLAVAGVGEYVAEVLAAMGLPLIFTGWLVASMVRIAQGSATVSMLTAAAMMAPLVDALAVHPVYMMMAVGCGGVIFPWYNDTGFWVVSEIGGLSQVETIKTFSIICTILSVVGMTVTLLLSTLLPMA